MSGADEYAAAFPTPRQIGKLYLYPSRHARGKTFEIWVLPSDELIGDKMPWAIKDAVQVFGITGGNPGWTETYGWLHKGPWQGDFKALYEERVRKVEESRKEREAAQLIKEAGEKEHTRQLFARY